MNTLFSDEFLEEIKDLNPFIAIQKLCEAFSKFWREKLLKDPIDLELYNVALNSYGFIFALAKKWEFNTAPISISGSRRDNLNSIVNFISVVNQIAEQKYSAEIISFASDKFNVIFGNDFFYEIDENDYTIIQKNINELRELLSNSTDIPDNHKQRLLKRLEELQKELNKRVRSFDKFFGVAIEISGYVGKVCENIKPFNDRLKEMLDIIAKIMKISTGAILLENNTEEGKIIEK